MTDTQNAKEQGTFDLDEFIQGRGFPTDIITLFTNADAAFELSRVNARMELLAQDKRQKEYKEEYSSLETRADELKAKILESALTVHLRGIAPGHIKKIAKDVSKEAEKNEWTEDEASDAMTARWFAPHIIKVVKADGAEDKGPFTPERLETWEFMFPASEWEKLNNAVSELSFRSTVFDSAVDAGFLPKS